MAFEWSTPTVGNVPTNDTAVQFSAHKQWGAGYEDIYQVGGTLVFSDNSGNGTESVADRAAVVKEVLEAAGYTVTAKVTTNADWPLTEV